MPQVPDFKTQIDPGGVATLTWKFLTASGKPTLPAGIVAVYNNANASMKLELSSVLGIDNPLQIQILVAPQIDSTGLIIMAQVGNPKANERYLVKLTIPLSNGDVPIPWNHLICDLPN